MKKKTSPNDIVSFLKTHWPGRRSKKIEEAFSHLKSAIKKGPEPTKISAQRSRDVVTGKTFNILDAVRNTCASHDFFFLSRQLTYHIAATSDLPHVVGNEAQYEAILSELVGYIAKHSPYASKIDIEIKETTLRRGHGLEITFKGRNEALKDISRDNFSKKLFSGVSPEVLQLQACKEAIIKEGGRFTVDLPEPKHTLFRVTLPTVTVVSQPSSNQAIFKYDISISNIANVRKRFGIRKSASLVAQVEEFVRSLLRHPIDIVTAVHDKGIITVIYEIQKEAPQSVAGRISARLGSEKFYIGKKEVDLEFRYNLSAIPPAQLRRGTKY